MDHHQTASRYICFVCVFTLVYILYMYNYTYSSTLDWHYSVIKVAYKDVSLSVHRNNTVTSDGYVEHGDTSYLETQHFLSNTSTINTMDILMAPKQLAKYNCAHFMTLAKGPLTRTNGRLGNKMFQTASLIGVAAWHGYTPVFIYNDYLVKVFELKVRTINFTIGNMAYVREGGCCAHSEKFNNLDHSKNWTLTGLLQSWKYFMRAERRIRKEFTFRQTFKVRVMKHLDSLGRKGAVTVGVHVRRGNITYKKRLKNLGFVTAPVSYIQRAMQFFIDKFSSSVRFIFVSNDLKWCKNNFNGTDIHFSPFTDPVLDMALLTSCNHTIITVGTFGWWGAWLANGVTVYYAGFPRPGSWLETQFNKTINYSDYYPQRWIGMY